MKIAFATDFDNTLTRRDFYWILIDKYFGKSGCDLHAKWQSGGLKDVDYLNCVFNAIDRSEDEILRDIDEIPMDETAVEFIRDFAANTGDVFVVSGGIDYYIDVVLKKYGIADRVKVYANRGYYLDRALYLVPPADTPYYSPVYGIDKKKVVEDLKRDYGCVFFAGDSKPDLEAALLADKVFARRGTALESLLAGRGVPFTPFDTFAGVAQAVRESLGSSCVSLRN